MNLDGVVFTLVALVVLLGATIVRPSVVRCPRGWYVEGVRPAGDTSCRRAPRNQLDDTAPEVDPAIGVRVFCRGPAIVVDHRTVGCQRRFL